MTKQRTEQEQQLANIFEQASKNYRGLTNVWAKVEHVSKSGMSRSIKLYVVVDGNIGDITWYVANALGKNRDRYWGITVKGCGMDMCYHLIDTVSHRIYGTDLHKNFSYSSL
jgi:hypothetical protein